MSVSQRLRNEDSNNGTRCCFGTATDKLELRSPKSHPTGANTALRRADADMMVQHGRTFCGVSGNLSFPCSRVAREPTPTWVLGPAHACACGLPHLSITRAHAT